MKQILKTLLFLILPIMLLSCGQMSGSGNADNSSETGHGSVSAKIIWPEEKGNQKTGLPQQPLMASMPDTIKTVTMTISGGGMTEISKDFTASDKKGVVPSVPVGSRTLTCQGKDAAGTLLYSGSNAVNVTEGGNIEVAVEMAYVGSDSLLKGLVAYYPFNGNATDESGNGNDGTVNGATLVADRFGKADRAFSFDGNDLINAGTAGIINNDNYTYVAWVKFSSLPPTGDVGTILKIGDNNGDQQLSVSTFTSGPNYSNKGFNLGSYYSDAQPFNNVNQGEIPLVDTWYQVIGVRNTIDYTLKLYLNGAKVAFKALYGTSAYYGNATFHIGTRNGTQSFNGLIDDIRIYNRALSDSEILALYNEGK